MSFWVDYSLTMYQQRRVNTNSSVKDDQATKVYRSRIADFKSVCSCSTGSLTEESASQWRSGLVRYTRMYLNNNKSYISIINRCFYYKRNHDLFKHCKKTWFLPKAVFLFWAILLRGSFDYSLANKLKVQRYFYLKLPGGFSVNWNSK